MIVDLFKFLRKKSSKSTRIKGTKPKKAKAKKKITKKRPTKKASAAKKLPVAKVTKPVAVVTHYFSKIKVAVLKLKAPIELGETLSFKGHTTNFSQNIVSMQIDHEPIRAAARGKEVGLRVDKRVRRNDKVFKQS